MTLNSHPVWKGSIARAATIALACTAIHCGSNDASAPSSGLVVSSVTLASATMAAGSTAGGTVTLSSAAPAGGTTIVLASSNPAVASVQSPVTVAAGSSSAAISISALAPGTATIGASLNGSTRQSQTLTVSARQGPAFASVTLSASSVVGGDAVRGTVVLSDVAPSAGVVVTLSSGDPVTVPPNVTVPAGSTTATFSVTTRAVTAATTVAVQASYNGANATAPLTVMPPSAATAHFGVSGPTETETCALANNGATLNCTFNGTTSTAPGRIVEWDWTYGVTGSAPLAQTTSNPILAMPNIGCQALPAPPLPSGAQWLTMTVTLVVRDDQGNVSPLASNGGVRLIPTGACGF